MSAHRLLALLVLAALWPLPGRAASTNDQQKVQIRTAKRAPAFVLSDLQNRPVRLADFAGKAVIVFFWASWDKLSQRQLPALIELQKQFPPEEFQVIGIALDQGAPAKLQTFATEHQINFPILRFDLKVIEDFGGLAAIPALFVIDKNHNIIQHYVGVIDKHILEDDLNLVLKKSP